MINSELDKVQANLISAEEDFNNTLIIVRNFSDRIYVNKPLQNIITTDFNDVQEVYSRYSELSFLDDYLGSFNEVLSFRLYTDNQTLLDNQYIIKTTPAVKSEKWYENAIKSKGQIFWIYKKDTITKKEYLSLVRSVWGSTNGTFIGVLVINVNPDVIKRNLSNQIYDTILVFENNIIFSTIENLKNDDILYLNDFLREQKPKHIKKLKIQGKKVGVVSENFYPRNSVSVKFNIMYLMPIKQLTRATNSLIIYTIIIFVIIILLTYIGINLYSYYADEKIRLENEQIIARQNEMRFKMLANQINPHFLFNTLETIRMKSLACSDRDIPTMLKLLASLLRYNLSVKGKPVPLIDEIQAIQNYLNIQHMRFGERISYDIITMCDIQKIQILPLLIQPIVENSFSHGLEEKLNGGFIYVLINTELKNNKQVLTITIEDNGCGMSEEQLTNLRKKIESNNSDDLTKSIGMVNVNSRIKMHYGEEYGIEIESTEGTGTKVKLTLLSEQG